MNVAYLQTDQLSNILSLDLQNIKNENNLVRKSKSAEKEIKTKNELKDLKA